MQTGAKAVNHVFCGNFHVAICFDKDGYFHAIQELGSDHKEWQPWVFGKKRSRSEKSAIMEACRDVIKRAEWNMRTNQEAKRICSEMSRCATKEIDSLRKVRKEQPHNVEHEIDAKVFWGLQALFDEPK